MNCNITLEINIIIISNIKFLNSITHMSSTALQFLNRILYLKLDFSGAVDKRTRQEVNMFLNAIDKNAPIMNLNGYANINRKLISSVSIPLFS